MVSSRADQEVDWKWASAGPPSSAALSLSPSLAAEMHAIQPRRKMGWTARCAYHKLEPR